MERAAETPPHMAMQWPEPASPTSRAPIRSRLLLIGLLVLRLGPVLFLVEQDIGALTVEILELLGANGPEEDDARDDDKQDGDGDEDEDDVQEKVPLFPVKSNFYREIEAVLVSRWPGFLG